MTDSNYKRHPLNERSPLNESSQVEVPTETHREVIRLLSEMGCFDVRGESLRDTEEFKALYRAIHRDRAACYAYGKAEVRGLLATAFGAGE